jgi:hypothetical protein
LPKKFLQRFHICVSSDYYIRQRNCWVAFSNTASIDIRLFSSALWLYSDRDNILWGGREGNNGYTTTRDLFSRRFYANIAIFAPAQVMDIHASKTLCTGLHQRCIGGFMHKKPTRDVSGPILWGGGGAYGFGFESTSDL